MTITQIYIQLIFLKLQLLTDTLQLLAHRNHGLLNVYICALLSIMQNVLYMAKETQVVPVLGNIFLIIRDVKYQGAFYIV